MRPPDRRIVVRSSLMASDLNPSIASKPTLGCLLALLLPGLLVSGLFFLMAIAGMAMPLFVETDEPVGYLLLTGAIVMAFSGPMVMLFGRGTIVTIQRLRGKPAGDLVPWWLAVVLALAYGLPSVAGAVVLGVTAGTDMTIGQIILGATGGLALVAAPVYLFIVRRRAAAAAKAPPGPAS